MKKETCKNCNGEGGWNISVPCSTDNVMFMSDGECMEIDFKDCFWCHGTGKLTSSRLNEVKKLKKKTKY